jgi:hypothetical protein
MSAIVGGVPFCGKCLDSMRCVKNGAVVVAGPGPIRRTYDCDVFECRGCKSRVFIPATKGGELPEGSVARAKAFLGEWLVDLGGQE